MRFSLFILVFGLAAACSSKPKAAPAAENNTVPSVEKAASAAVKNAEKAAESAGVTAAKVECSTKGDSRVLELRPKNKGCELAYTKNGQEGIVATSGNGSAYCENTMNKIRDRLKGSGFDCK